jgi:hypothetical protein
MKYISLESEYRNYLWRKNWFLLAYYVRKFVYNLKSRTNKQRYK